MAGDAENILCPCVKCKNTTSGSREMIQAHLLVNGMMQSYTKWVYHGEKINDDEELSESDSDDIDEMIRDIFPHVDSSCRSENNQQEPNDEAKAFYRLLDDSKQPTYPSCETSKLESVVNLLEMKSIGRWSNESFNMLLTFLKRILPEGSVLPKSYYETKKIVNDLGLSYQKIDACKNDCMLYWKEDINSDICKICGSSRWKEDSRTGVSKIRSNGKKVPVKTLRYFPLKPRLQWLFMCSKIAPFMRWHCDERVDDGVLRHPADSMAWKSFDDKYKDFSTEPRNVRLGLASDGFQPFTH